MKKVISLLLVSMIAIGVSVAQQGTLSKKEQRKIEKQKAEKLYEEQLQAAIESGTFSFEGQTMRIKNLDRYNLRGPYNAVYIQPEYIRLQLPYFTSRFTMGNSPLILDFESDNFTYTYKKERGAYIVTIEVKAIKNTFNTARKTPSGYYKMVFTITTSNGGTTFLDLSPSFTATIQYQGRVEIDHLRKR